MKVLKQAQRMGACQTDSARQGAVQPLGREEVMELIPSLRPQELGNSYDVERESSGQLRIKTNYQNLLVVDDGVRHAQGTLGLGLGTATSRSRFFEEEDEGEDELAANSEAVWREFE